MIVKEFTVTLTVSGDASRVDETWVQAALDTLADEFNKHYGPNTAAVEDVVVTLVNEEPI